MSKAIAESVDQKPGDAGVVGNAKTPEISAMIRAQQEEAARIAEAMDALVKNNFTEDDDVHAPEGVPPDAVPVLQAYRSAAPPNAQSTPAASTTVNIMDILNQSRVQAINAPYRTSAATTLPADLLALIADDTPISE
jgi:hypothetical protein